MDLKRLRAFITVTEEARCPAALRLLPARLVAKIIDEDSVKALIELAVDWYSPEQVVAVEVPGMLSPWPCLPSKRTSCEAEVGLLHAASRSH